MFKVDELSTVFVAVFLLMSVPALIYSISIHKEKRYLLNALLFIAMSLATVTTGDFFSFLVFWELMMLFSYLLIINKLRTIDLCIGFRYMITHIISGVSLFTGIIIQYAATNSMEFGQIVPEAFLFFALSAGIKAAVIPFHTWIPDSYAKVPIGTSVILSIYTTKVGVYAFARILSGYPIIAYAGTLMAVFGVIMALREKDGRRLLSYHIISQVGYMITGVGISTELGINAGTLHVFNHVIYKSLLFMSIGTVMYVTKTSDMSKLGGLARYMPITFISGLIGALAISGAPPFNGFISKTLLKYATESHPFLYWGLLLAGIGTTLSFSKFIWYIFLYPNPNRKEYEIKKIPTPMLISMSFLSVLCLISGLFYQPITQLLAYDMFIPIYTLENLSSGILIFLGGIILFVLARDIIQPTNRERSWDLDLLYSSILTKITNLAKKLAINTEYHAQAHLTLITGVLVGIILFFLI